MRRIALTKGRLLEPSLAWLQSLGFERPDLGSRTLRHAIGLGWEAVLLKGPDVPVFVQNGAADLGIVGSDVLEEDGPDVYDLKALGFGNCRLSLAAPVGWSPTPGATLKAATKYPKLSERHLGRLGYMVRTIRVSSSAELAPTLGLSEVIVDIVDSGRTLLENGLMEMQQLCSIQAHLIASRSAYRFFGDRWWEG